MLLNKYFPCLLQGIYVKPFFQMEWALKESLGLVYWKGREESYTGYFFIL